MVGRTRLLNCRELLLLFLLLLLLLLFCMKTHSYSSLLVVMELESIHIVVLNVMALVGIFFFLLNLNNLIGSTRLDYE